MKPKKILSLICLGLSLLIIFEFNEIWYVFSKTSYESVAQITFNKNSDFEYRATLDHLDEGFVVMEQSSLTFYDELGNRIWSKNLTSENTLISTGTDRFVIAEKKAGDVFILSQSGEILSSILGLGKITDVNLFEDTFVGVLKADGNLNMYDEKLNLLGVTNLPKGEMITYDVNAEHQDIVMGILDLSRTDFNSKLVIGGFNGTIMSGSNLIQDLIYAIDLTPKEMFVTTDHQLRIYTYDSTLIQAIDFDRTLHHIVFDSVAQQILLQLTNDEASIDNPKAKQTLVCYDAKGQIIFELTLPLDEIEGVKLFKDKLCVYNTREVVILDKEGRVQERYLGKEPIKDVLLTTLDTFGIVYDNSMVVYAKK